MMAAAYRWVLCGMLAMVAPQAHSQALDVARLTSCIAARAGDVAGEGEYGRWWAAWCPDGRGDWRRIIVVAKTGYVLREPALPAGAGVAAIAAAYWRDNVTQDCNTTTDARIIDLCMAATRASMATMPLPPWIVRPNGSYATRPTYPVINGVRSRTSNGSITIVDASGRPQACNYAGTRVVEGSNVYAQVKQAGTVTLCSPSAP